MKKKIQVVMLPTNQKANLYLHKTKGLFLLASIKHEINQYNGSNQHLYFLSDEQPKEDDWVIYNIHCSDKLNDFNTINEKALIVQYNKAVHQNIKYCKKVIATTDESLKTFTSGVIKVGHRYGFTTLELPQPSKEFIQHYVEQYNKGNIIEWVEVEYETVTDWNNYTISFKGNGGATHKEKIQLKINNDNTINISPIKDSFSRDEVIALLKNHADFIDDLYRPYTKDNVKGWENCDKWISENL